MRQAVMYTRVSSKDQEREGYSIPAQQALLREYASKQGLQIVREFVDVETAKVAGQSSRTLRDRWRVRRPAAQIGCAPKRRGYSSA